MSCRTTRGGSLSLRLARIYSGLPEKQAQALFHALKREGKDLPDPTEEDLKMWRESQRALIDNADLTPKQREAAERDLFRSHSETPDGALFHAWSRIEVRTRQEATLQALPDAIDLAPAGSQHTQYDLKDGVPQKVWYASYGSNMDRARFLTYIEGGTPAGTTTPHLGAQDSTPPQGDIPIRFPGRIHFAYESRRWDDGGVAFLDSDPTGHVLGRAYLVTGDQFADVVAQENGGLPGTADIPWMALLHNGDAEISGSALYNTMTHIGDYDGAPVITFTGGFTAQDALREGTTLDRGGKGDPRIAANEPAPNYMRMLGAGLADTFNMTDHQQADYLRGAGGAETWPRRQLLRTLRTPPTPPKKRTTYNSFKPQSGTFSRADAAAAAEAASGTKQGNPWVLGGTPSARTCPMCGKPGHTMHDCHLLRRDDDALF